MCDRDCFNCIHADCILDGYSYAEKRLQDAFDKDLEPHSPTYVYNHSKGHKEAQARYEKSEKGRDRQQTYNNSEKGKERSKVYNSSERGKDRWRRYYQRKKLRLQQGVI